MLPYSYYGTRAHPPRRVRLVVQLVTEEAVSIFKIGSCAPGALSLLLTFAKYSCARACHELHSKLARSLRSVSPLGRRWCAWVEAGVAGVSRPARIRSHMRTDRRRFAAASHRPSAWLVRLWTAALLHDARELFDKKDSKADENIRQEIAAPLVASYARCGGRMQRRS